MTRPFIYIASLRRTGSTVLAEALTRMPDAFIFREPGLGTGSFTLKNDDVQVWKNVGVDLRGFVRRNTGSRGVLLDAFRAELLPRLLDHAAQIGVKEIFHHGWREVFRVLPNPKVLLTGRDPRDVYISLHDRVRERDGKGWEGPFNPEAVAANLNAEFERQRRMLDVTDCLKVRYEDFCSDPAVLEEIKRFVDSPLEGVGAVGSFNASNPNRVGEYRVHGDEITAKRLARWKSEPDEELRREAERMIGLMGEYSRFWEYE